MKSKRPIVDEVAAFLVEQNSIKLQMFSQQQIPIVAPSLRPKHVQLNRSPCDHHQLQTVRSKVITTMWSCRSTTPHDVLSMWFGYVGVGSMPMDSHWLTIDTHGLAQTLLSNIDSSKSVPVWPRHTMTNTAVETIASSLRRVWKIGISDIIKWFVI